MSMKEKNMKKIHWNSDCARTIDELHLKYKIAQEQIEQWSNLYICAEATKSNLQTECDELKKQVSDLQKLNETLNLQIHTPSKPLRKKKTNEIERGTTDHA